MLKFLSQIDNMLVYVSATYIFDKDLKMCQIIEILTYPEELSVFDSKWSNDDRMLDMVCHPENYLDEKLSVILCHSK